MAERSDRTERNVRNEGNEGNDNQQVTNRNRRGSISEWRSRLTEEPREPRREENVIHWSWDDQEVQNGVHPADATANDKTLAEWISITENKDLFRNTGEEDTHGEILDNWMNQINKQFPYRKNGDDDDDENNQGGVGSVSGAGHRIGSSSTYVSGTSSSGNTRSSNSSNRNTRSSNNTSSRNNTIRNCGTNRNSSGNITEDSTIEGVGENMDIHVNKGMKQEENRIFHDWLKRTENPDLYKRQTGEEDDDAEYQQMIKYIDLESAGTLIWEKVYAQTSLESELEKKNKKKRKKVYSLFNNGSDFEDFASPKKKSGHAFFPVNENETDVTIFEKEDINKTPSIFEIRNHETNYFETFPENTVKNRESSEVNKSTDSFVSGSSIVSLKTKRCQNSKNTELEQTDDMADFFNDNMIYEKNSTYETSKKFLKYKMSSDKNKDVGIESAPGLVKRKKRKEKKRDRREKREDQPFSGKGKKIIDPDKFSSANKHNGDFSYYDNFLHYTDTKSSLYNTHTLEEYNDFHRRPETEITPATPSRN